MRFASALVTLAAAAPASGQEPIVAPGGQVRAMRDAPVTIAGRVTVEFHGDAAAGCAMTGVCGLAGTVVWTPSRHGELAVTEYALRGRRRFAATLSPTGASLTSARVSRRGADGSTGVCSDTGRFYAGTAAADAPAGRAARISLPGTNIRGSLGVDALMTRCAGPLLGDLAGVLPTAPLGRALPQPGTRLDLRGRRPFAAHGFAGTIDSTITVRVGRPGRRPNTRVPGQRKTRRHLTVTYAIERIEGGVSTTLAGSPDPAACGPRDACGVTGTITAAFGQVREGRLTFIAAAEGRRPWRDLRTALGLTRGGRRGGVTVLGYGGWEGGPGSVVQAFAQRPDGGPPCTDSAPLVSGSVYTLPAPRGGIKVALSGADTLRTRCPGPRSADAAPFEGASLTAGRLAIRALASSRPILHLAHDAPFTSGGYTGLMRIDLALHLRRVRLTRRTIRS